MSDSANSMKDLPETGITQEAPLVLSETCYPKIMRVEANRRCILRI